MKFDRAVNQPTNLCTRGLTHLSISIVSPLHMLCQGWTPVRQMNRFISALQPDHIAPTEVQMRIDRLCSHAWTGDFDAAMVEMGLSAARVTGQVFRKGEYAPAVSQWASEAVAPSKDMSSLVNGKCGDPARHYMPLELQGMSILQIARACRNPVASNGGHAIAALLVTHGAVDDAPDTVGTGSRWERRRGRGGVRGWRVRWRIHLILILCLSSAVIPLFSSRHGALSSFAARPRPCDLPAAPPSPPAPPAAADVAASTEPQRRRGALLGCYRKHHQPGAAPDRREDAGKRREETTAADTWHGSHPSATCRQEHGTQHGLQLGLQHGLQHGLQLGIGLDVYDVHHAERGGCQGLRGVQ